MDGPIPDMVTPAHATDGHHSSSVTVNG